VEWFCGLKGKESFVEVDEDYINDDFNLTGLQSFVPNYRKALDVILDVADPDDDSPVSDEDDELNGEVELAAQVLYGLIHARFLLTNRGMELIQEKVEAAIYGHCPNSCCGGQPVLPVGISDFPAYYKCKVFCPKCNEVYHPEFCPLAEMDGAFFGTSFAHMFLMRYREDTQLASADRAVPEYYVPKIYGFRVHRNVKDRLRNYQSSSSAAGRRGRSWQQKPSSPSNLVKGVSVGGVDQQLDTIVKDSPSRGLMAAVVV